MHRETVREEKLRLGLHIRHHLILEDIGLHVVGHEEHDKIGDLGRLRHRVDLKSVGLGLRLRLASLVQRDDRFDAAVAQVLRMGVSLAAVADDRHRLAVQKFEVRVAVVINLCHNRKHSLIRILCISL